MRTRVLTLAICAAALALSACSSSGPAANAPTPTPTGTQPAPVNTASPSASSSAPTTGSAPPSSPTSVNRTVVDPELGNRFTVVKYVVGYQPSPAALQQDSSLGDDDVVLVDLSVTASSTSTTSVGSTSFSIEGTSVDTETLPTDELSAELKAAGYPALADAQPGRTSTGWVAFAVKKTQPSYVLRYERVATKTAAGRSVAAKTFSVTLG